MENTIRSIFHSPFQSIFQSNDWRHPCNWAQLHLESAVCFALELDVCMPYKCYHLCLQLYAEVHLDSAQCLHCRHHVYRRERHNEVQLKEVGPRFELRCKDVIMVVGNSTRGSTIMDNRMQGTGLETHIYRVKYGFHWKCLSVSNQDFRSTTVQLLLWPYISSRPFQGCKGLASEQSLCRTRGATVPRYHNI